MNERLEEDSIRLESMLPRLMRYMFRHDTTDPLGHLSVAQLRMMRVLHGEPKIATDLSEELGMTPSAISQSVQRLERMGLVERHAAASDRRVRLLALSESGQQLMKLRQATRVARARTVLAELSEETRARLISSLEELFQHVDSRTSRQADSLTMVAELEQTLPPSISTKGPYPPSDRPAL